MKVNIYLETDKQSQECMQRKYGYVIETIFKGTPITREGFGSIEGTYHKTNLQALIKALGHFHIECEVCVYTRRICCNADPESWRHDGSRIQGHKRKTDKERPGVGHSLQEAAGVQYHNILTDWETYIFSMATGGNEET